MSPARVPHPIVIAHRGASGYLPEHTLASYSMAIQQGADYLEPDLVMTRDQVLIARHENALASLYPDGSIREATTDVAEHPEFASRQTTKLIDGTAIKGWFTEDFTLAELKTLRARERLPALRPGSARLDGRFEIPTFEEVLNLIDDANRRRRREARTQGRKTPAAIGVYPETKHPSYFERLGLALEAPLLALLHRHGYDSPAAPVLIQSFEVGHLKKLHRMTRLPLVQLLDASGRPFDLALAGDPRTYAELATPAGLREIATYAAAIGVNKALIFPCDTQARIGTPTALIGDAHAAGLRVHGWTFRAENIFLPANFASPGASPAEPGDLAGEVRVFLEADMDGLFTDQPDIAVRARDAFIAER